MFRKRDSGGAGATESGVWAGRGDDIRIDKTIAYFIGMIPCGRKSMFQSIKN
jgi:hypothetical protein